MTASSDSAFADVASALQNDPDDDVSVDGSRLLVHGRPFASLDGDELLVEFPAARAIDLVTRGMASAASGPAEARGTWVSVGDSENWLELATEAHQFVGEPPVGRQS